MKRVIVIIVLFLVWALVPGAEGAPAPTPTSCLQPPPSMRSVFLPYASKIIPTPTPDSPLPIPTLTPDSPLPTPTLSPTPTPDGNVYLPFVLKGAENE